MQDCSCYLAFLHKASKYFQAENCGSPSVEHALREYQGFGLGLPSWGLKSQPAAERRRLSSACTRIDKPFSKLLEEMSPTWESTGKWDVEGAVGLGFRVDSSF